MGCGPVVVSVAVLGGRFESRDHAFAKASVWKGLSMLLLIKLATKFVRCNIFCYN
jgi:hypothetical protein